LSLTSPEPETSHHPSFPIREDSLRC